MTSFGSLAPTYAFHLPFLRDSLESNFIYLKKVMVTVAKSFDAPIKVIWPKDIFALISQGLLKVPEGTQFSLLGLGDIVLPGKLISKSLVLEKVMADINVN